MSIKKRLILILITIVLFLIPNLFWFKEMYAVSGDGTMLYYLFPQEMARYNLTQVNFNVLYGEGIYQVPLFLFIAFIKYLLPFLNTQAFLYGLNLSLGFLSFYTFLGLFLKKSYEFNFYIKSSCSLFYIFSVYSFNTLWSGSFVIYLISLFPLTLYLFFKAIAQNKIIIIIINAIIISIFSAVFFPTPWLILGILTISPFLLIFLMPYKKKLLKYLILFLGTIILLNSYWLISFLPSSSMPNNSTIFADIAAEKDGSESLIREVTYQNNLIYPLFNLFFPHLASQGYKTFQHYHEFFLPFNLIPLFIIFIAGMLLKFTDQFSKKLYLGALLGWIIAIYFYTVNIFGHMGFNLFLFFMKNVPGFIMFRNNYGKIAPALPFIYALLLAISLFIIFKKITNKTYKYSILFIITTICILSSVPFISGKYYQSAIWSAKNTYATISDFNTDFYSLIRYLNKNNIPDKSRILWLPMSLVNYIFIQDKNLENHYYFGPSPLKFLASGHEISSLMHLPSGTSEKFTQNLFAKKNSENIVFLKKLNIRYIIYNKGLSSEILNSYLFTLYSPGDFYRIQEGEFINSLLGKRIASFGNRYDLYEIK